MRVACLLIPRFGLACEVTEQPELADGAPTLALVDGRVVREVSPAAQRYGVHAGQRLQEAFAACPYLVTIEARPGHYERRFRVILDRMADLSPEVEAGPLGTAYIDLNGLSRHYPNPERLAARVLSCAPAVMRPRLGIGPGKFPACVLASRLKAGRHREIVRTQVPDALAAVSVDLLPVDHRMIRRLHQLGIHQLGTLAALPRHAVAAQFGPEGSLAWDLANGDDSTPVRGLRPEESVAVSQLFIDPILSRDLLLAAAEQLLGRAHRALSERRQAARLARVSIDLERGKGWEKQVTFKESRYDRSALWAAIRPVIESAELPTPIVGMNLELSRLTSVIGWQTPLWGGERRQRRERLQEALRQLTARYGSCPVGQIVEVEPWSRIPERRAAIVAFDP